MIRTESFKRPIIKSFGHGDICTSLNFINVVMVTYMDYLQALPGSIGVIIVGNKMLNLTIHR